MLNEYVIHSKCRMCKSEEIDLEMTLANLPIGDRYVPESENHLNVKTYPLNVMICHQCGHYQNSGYVKPELIYKNYLSRPATTNPILSDAYKEYAEYLLDNFPSSATTFAVETGSNDGAFSKYMQDKGSKVLAIEPAPNLVQQANSQGIPTLERYFSLALAKEIANEYGHADFFIANHMLANVPDLADFAQGVEYLLKDTGVFSMQTFYQLDVVEKNLIENFTHEHLSYFYIKSFNNFCDKFDLQLFDVKRVPAKGGSIRCFVQKKGGRHAISNSVAEMIAEEDKLGIGSIGRLGSVEKYIKHTKSKLMRLLTSEVEAGKKIAGFGTSIGATTFLYNLGLGELLTFFVDDDAYRHNLVSPGFHIPVLPTSILYEEKPDYVIILAPLYADAIIKKNQRFLDEGGVFIKFWPEFELIKK